MEAAHLAYGTRGLGFKDDRTHAQALLYKWVAKALENPNIDWAQLFLEISKRLSGENLRLLNKASYTDQDRMLLGTIKSYGVIKYVTWVWKS